MRQTSKLQLTAVRFAKLGKNKQGAFARELRAAARQQAWSQNLAPQQTSKLQALVWLVHQMHEACQADATANGGVIRAARSVGCLSFLPQLGGVRGLRRATGPERETCAE
eukprot:14343801-Alexandrium_andersonii.AAC.1